MENDIKYLMDSLKKLVYIGDGLYASFDGFHLKVASSDGVNNLDTIYFDPDVLLSFENYIKSIREQVASINAKAEQ